MTRRNSYYRHEKLYNSISLLEVKGIEYKKLNEYHYRIGVYDFWPSTDKFLNRHTGEFGHSIFVLLDLIEQSPDTEKIPTMAEVREGILKVFDPNNYT